jgi:hypothetical protein
LEWRKRLGECLKPESTLFRREFDIEDSLRVNNPQPLSVRAIRSNITKLLKESGIRIPRLTEQNTHPRRTEIMACHGFRKFFDTTTSQAGMNPLYVEILEGHTSGLKFRYFKPSESELLEGNDKVLGYISVIDALTIREENRLKRKVNELTGRQNEVQQLKYKHEQEMESMRNEMKHQFNEIMSMIQQNAQLAFIKPEALTQKIIEQVKSE